MADIHRATLDAHEEAKKKNADNPHRWQAHFPKSSFSKENRLLMEEVFDANGNYIYHLKCIMSMIPNVSQNRLTKLHNLKVEKKLPHGNSGRSNSSNSDVGEHVMEYADKNSTVTGRKMGKLRYIDPIITQWYLPSKKFQEKYQ